MPILSSSKNRHIFKIPIFALLLSLLPHITLIYAQTIQWEPIPLDINFPTSLETTPWGLAMGEDDSRIWTNPFNGIYLSKDLGNSWHIKGLGDRGITDLHYFNDSTGVDHIYAATHYGVSGLIGLFESTDIQTWNHLGPLFSASAVCRDSNTIYLGGFSHGLWVAGSDGSVWEQKIGAGWYGPEIYSISCSENSVLASTEDGLYISRNSGNSWELVAFFLDFSVRNLFSREDILLVSTTNGLFYSTDTGASWVELPFFTGRNTGLIFRDKNTYYIESRNSDGSKKTIFKSDDLQTWADTQLNLPLTSNFVQMFTVTSKPSYLYMVSRSIGIYRYITSEWVGYSNQFLEIPWEYNAANELTDRLTAYFDHEYPLLGYSYHKEPGDASTSVVNFQGIRESPPKMYYSSHSGSDFYLDFGTPVKASYSGIASYYYCESCGNSIKIDHDNGYQSIYMHLQSTGLVTTDSPVWVDTGQIIGLVGLTGNTSGPHLHFEIMRDINGDGIFNDYPHGRTDPFGWFGETKLDPWHKYEWEDITGSHRGTASEYLWTVSIPEYTEFITTQGGTYYLDNKEIEFQSGFSDNNVTLTLTNGPRGETSDAQKDLNYVNNTSFIIELFDLVGRKIKDLLNSATIKIRPSSEDIAEQNIETLGIYSWNNTNSSWELLNTNINYDTSTLTAETTHLSRFAVFGRNPINNPFKVRVKNAVFSIP